MFSVIPITGLKLGKGEHLVDVAVLNDHRFALLDSRRRIHLIDSKGRVTKVITSVEHGYFQYSRHGGGLGLSAAGSQIVVSDTANRKILVLDDFGILSSTFRTKNPMLRPDVLGDELVACIETEGARDMVVRYDLINGSEQVEFLPCSRNSQIQFRFALHSPRGIVLINDHTSEVYLGTGTSSSYLLTPAEPRQPQSFAQRSIFGGVARDVMEVLVLDAAIAPDRNTLSVIRGASFNEPLFWLVNLSERKVVAVHATAADIGAGMKGIYWRGCFGPTGNLFLLFLPYSLLDPPHLLCYSNTR